MLEVHFKIGKFRFIKDRSLKFLMKPLINPGVEHV